MKNLIVFFFEYRRILFFGIPPIAIMDGFGLIFEREYSSKLFQMPSPVLFALACLVICTYFIMYGFVVRPINRAFKNKFIKGEVVETFLDDMTTREKNKFLYAAFFDRAYFNSVLNRG